MEKAPQTTLLQSQSPGAQSSSKSEVHKAGQESLKGEGASDRLFNCLQCRCDAPPSLHLGHSLLQCPSVLDYCGQAFRLHHQSLSY